MVAFFLAQVLVLFFSYNGKDFIMFAVLMVLSGLLREAQIGT